MNVIGLPQRLLTEFLGTAPLITGVVESGIAAAQLSPEDVGLPCRRTRLPLPRR